MALLTSCQAIAPAQLVYPGAKRARVRDRRDRAGHTFTEFELFLSSERLPCYVTSAFPLSRNSRSVRIERIKKRGSTLGGDRRGFGCGYTASHFALASKKRVDSKEPGSDGGRPGDNPEGGAEPLPRMNCRTAENTQTGLADLSCPAMDGFSGFPTPSPCHSGNYHFDTKEVERLTRKGRKKLFCRFTPKLLFAMKRSGESQRSAYRPCLVKTLLPASRSPVHGSISG